VGIFVEPLRRIGDADIVHGFFGNFVGLASGDLLMEPHGFDDLFTDGEDRVERSHRLLKDHGNIFAAHMLHLFFGTCQQIAPIE